MTSVLKQLSMIAYAISPPVKYDSIGTLVPSTFTVSPCLAKIELNSSKNTTGNSSANTIARGLRLVLFSP